MCGPMPKQKCQWCISWLHYDSAEYRERRALCAVYFTSWCTPPKFRNLPIAVDVGLLVNFKETYYATILYCTSCMYRLRYKHHRLTKSLNVFPMNYNSFQQPGLSRPISWDSLLSQDRNSKVYTLCAPHISTYGSSYINLLACRRIEL
jgi:hypothetical protein